MHGISYFGFLRSGNLSKGFFFLYFFFALPCFSHDAKWPQIKENERPKIEAFLNELLFQESGVFTLFGDKPITCLMFFNGNLNDISLDGVQQEPSYEEVRTEETWRAWKKYAEKLHMRNFRFIGKLCPCDPSHMQVFFINLKCTMEMLQKIDSKSITREKLIEQLNDPKSLFWDRIAKDHVFAGLMYGYGKENAQQFMKNKKKRFSEIFDGVANQEKFPIPMFACAKDDCTSSRYREQRSSIAKKYKNKDLLSVTLQRLMEEL